MWWLGLLLLPLLAYLALVALVFFKQGSVLFPTGSVAPGEALPRSALPLEIETPSGDIVRGVHLPASRPRDERLLVLGFGGNAWNAGSTAAYLADLYPEADVVAFHYRGYPPSTGRPSAAAFQADAPLIHDLAVGRVGPARTIAVGFSIGVGVAASLASRRPLDGVILVTPFASLGDVAAAQIRWLPARLLLRHRMEPGRDLSGLAMLVALIAAERDTLIPPRHADALRRAVPNVAFARVIEGAGHNDIYDNPAFYAAMREALERIAAD